MNEKSLDSMKDVALRNKEQQVIRQNEQAL